MGKMKLDCQRGIFECNSGIIRGAANAVSFRKVCFMERELIIILSVIGGVILLLLIGLLSVIYSIKPGKSSAAEKYRKVKFAHRGLHGEGVPENSLSAFKRARDGGFGIELDVQCSRDGILVVFHDPTLMRVCGVSGRVSDYTAEELSGIKLMGTSEGIPTFGQVLNEIDGAVPILVEIKTDIECEAVAERLVEEIADYGGELLVESFHPLAIRTVRRKRPDIVRGILSKPYKNEEQYKGKSGYYFLENLMTNFYSRPQFIAYERTGYANRTLRFIRKVWGTPLFAWTVNSEKEEEEALSRGYDTVIFEGYLPE